MGENDVRDISVLKPVSNDADFGDVFTDVFRDYAKKKNKTYVLAQFPKDKPEEASFDYVNCESPNKAFMQLREALKGNVKENENA